MPTLAAAGLTSIAGLISGAATLVAAPQIASATMASPSSILSSLVDVNIGSTISANGDTNPYGIAIVPQNYVPTSNSLWQPGDVIVSDFNNSAGTNGAGSSIVRIRNGVTTTISQGQLFGTAGLAFNANGAALWTSNIGPTPSGMPSGDVSIVLGNNNPNGAALASTNGSGTINNKTTASNKVTNSFNGPWGQAFNGNGSSPVFYWSNVNDGKVYSISNLTAPNFGADRVTLLASLPWGPAPGSSSSSATNLGPSAIVYSKANDTLYATDAYNNSVYAISGVSTSSPTTSLVVSNGALNVPVGITINPLNGDLLVANGGVNTIVEINPMTKMVDAMRNVAPNEPPGSLFGIQAVTLSDGSLAIYYLNDTQNSVHELVTRSTPGGYRFASSDGGVFSYGDASYYGGAASMKLNKPIVGIASTPDGKGYWLVAADGGVFSYGDASYYGGAASMKLNQPIVGILATPYGGGYWLIAQDGGVFSYGDASYMGSTGGMVLAAPVVG
ncbi:NHL repeat-containing protein [Acidithrix ferrooxidans]|uniref:Uncharacterized protein n=1 Tax=Acidithrix ferrooxidans TaxID=1280514 RepID=A0A0D8HJ98_9ACTN|nr:hypothetical protein [Acidithrix ferrooxidans]KJF18003.1 hypothetical protein AXFE_11000 [Acidithrix ferrooxidans]